MMSNINLKDNCTSQVNKGHILKTLSSQGSFMPLPTNTSTCQTYWIHCTWSIFGPIVILQKSILQKESATLIQNMIPDKKREGFGLATLKLLNGVQYCQPLIAHPNFLGLEILTSLKPSPNNASDSRNYLIDRWWYFSMGASNCCCFS